MVMTAIVVGATGLFARGQFAGTVASSEARGPVVFWVLVLAIWSALNIVFVAEDLFTLYVALELLTFAAVPLVCFDGNAETLAAALRYLLFALIGSVLYLLGTALIYGTHGTLDIGLLAPLVQADRFVWVAISLMTVGLLAKTALFPLHLWLPPAHAGAPAAASAVLSALVVKGSFFIIVRLWFDLIPHLPNPLSQQILGALGAAAIIVGSTLAIRQARLKLLIAYSTVAQIGYLFLVFPLALGATVNPWTTIAATGGVIQLISHAFAKAAMFMAAGLIAKAIGHDRIDGFAGLGRALPITVIALGIGGLSLMGLPPSGGFVAKWMMLTASVTQGQWWWAVVILFGGLLAAIYIFRVLGQAFSLSTHPLHLEKPVPLGKQLTVLGLALAAVLLGFIPMEPLPLLSIGHADIVGGVQP